MNKKTKKENKKGTGRGDESHCLQLLERSMLELRRVFIGSEMRTAIKGLLTDMEESLNQMDERDEEYQNQPDKKIENLKKELDHNDAILKKNLDDVRMQIHRGLLKKGFPEGSPMWDTLMEKMWLEIQEDQLKVDSGFSTIHPTYTFQVSEEWKDLQMRIHQKILKAKRENLAEIELNVEEVKKEIDEQNERIKARRTQIIEDLKDLGVDVEVEKKEKDYIG